MWFCNSYLKIDDGPSGLGQARSLEQRLADSTLLMPKYDSSPFKSPIRSYQIYCLPLEDLHSEKSSSFTGVAATPSYHVYFAV